MNGARIRTTGTPDVIARSDGRLTVSVPIRIRRRGGRTIVATANVDFDPYAKPTPLQQALLRGYRWLAMLESGKFQSLKEIAKREGVCSSYVSRMVNLTTLAPDIVAAILDDTMPNDVTLFELAVDLPRVWEGQRDRLSTCNKAA